MSGEKKIPVHLYGHLRKKFGIKVIELAVKSPSEAIRALDSQLPGFSAWVSSHGSYKVLVGKEAQTLDTLGNPIGGGECIKIVPVVAGASDWEQALVGVAIIAMSGGFGAALMIGGGGWLATVGMNIGVAMVLGGVAQMLSTAPKIGTNGGAADTPTYSFGSPTVTVGQGRPVPLFYGGPLEVGGAIVSAGIVSEGYQSGGFGGIAEKTLDPADGKMHDAGAWSGNGDSIPWTAAIEPAM